MINKHTKGEEKRSFQAFLREEKREPRSEEQGTSQKRKKSLSCLYPTMTQDCKHTTKKTKKKTKNNNKREEEEEDDPGSTARDRPAGPRHVTARHG